MKPTEKSLLQQLTEYHDDFLPMHMPGHKQNEAVLPAPFPFALDVTEVDGFDNLHDMQGVLKKTAELAASLYGARASFPLVNGTTCGILAAIHALVPYGAHVLLARNCHKSVYNAVMLNGLYPHYLIPETTPHGIGGKITKESVEKALMQDERIALVVLTSPTYEGVVSDTEGISAVCKKYGVTLLVDAAHGAHLIDERICRGADVAVMSLHKTMPALTQTALLHIFSDCVDTKKIKEALSVFETSSPSYVLLSSIDECLRLVHTHGKALFDAFYKNLDAFYQKAQSCKNLFVTSYDDKSKILIFTKNTNISGTELLSRLRENYHITLEMADTDFALAMTSICDSKESLDRLLDALLDIDKTLKKTKRDWAPSLTPHIPPLAHTPSQARLLDGTFVPVTDAVGLEALEYVFAYPPGIPLIAPGEIIDKRTVEAIETLIKSGIAPKSTEGALPKIKVAK